MNWEAIGAFGESLGAIAVVVSLLYLAAQIRQNSRIVKGTTVHSITQTIQSELRWSADFREMFVKVIESPESLSKDEAFALGEWMTAAMMARQNEFIQFKQSLIDDSTWHGCRGILKNMLAIPWVRTWWAEFDNSVFTPEFIALVGSVLEEGFDFDYQDYLRGIDLG
ncbi:MAG: hypothetical protein GWM88_05645 [Pseudomonadales bacterium]|nr:hypothetical protein [Pseudomonadales bacterium]NIX07519.1 hypothetical protein [Pseudomonadales bacterium]